MSIHDEALKPREEGEIPYIYAKRHLKDPLPYPIHDKSNWEGLRRVFRRGKVEFETHEDFCLRIEGNDEKEPHIIGFCKIPDTENNRKRLKALSKPREEDATEIQIGDEGERIQVPIKVSIPPLYTRLDKSLVKESALEEMWEKLKEKAEKEGFQLVPKAKIEEPVEKRPDPNVVISSSVNVIASEPEDMGGDLEPLPEPEEEKPAASKRKKDLIGKI